MTNNIINSNPRFVRWHQVLREHLTFLCNLILTLSVGTVGFLLSLLSKQYFTLTTCQKIFFSFGLIITFTSIVFGLAASLSRLFDFRTTVKKIKTELKNKENSEIDELKQLMDIYKKRTWFFFYSQVITFCLAIISLTIAFLMIYRDKLF